jgi:methylglutaconyl-CoA hydratase
MGAGLLSSVDGAGRATLTLDRPERHNAFDEALIAELSGALRRVEADPAVRVVLLAANGPSFSSGGDLAWMRRMAGYSREENLKDARGLAELLRTLNELAKPTVALVQGPALAGGVGLLACCDVVLARPDVWFAVSEVRLGLIPAVIMPYLCTALGERAARRYVLTAERFGAEEARRLGLVHEIVDDLPAAADRLCAALLAGGPAAVAAAKRHLLAVARRPLDAALIEEAAERIAAVRASAEAQEGLRAFFEKRPPAWAVSQDPGAS